MKRLSQNDATLVAARAEAQMLLRHDLSLGYDRDGTDDAHMFRWASLSRKIAKTPADTTVGIVAKALSLLDEIDEITTDGGDEISIDGVESLCNDIVRLLTEKRS